MLTAVLGLVAYLALGYGSRSFEAYCPFGGVESLWGLFTARQFTCSLSPLNLSMLLAVVALTLVCKKAFCGWACPIGFIGEIAYRLGGRVGRQRPVPPGLDRRLRLLRYVVLIIALFFTYRTGELVLRGYDPFFLLFSGFGHGSAGLISAAVLGLTAAAMWVLPMFFCRYLCPLGAVLDPFSRFAPVRLFRNESRCTACRHCSRACPHGLAVHRIRSMRHRDCTNCLECVDACAEKGALELRIGL